MYRFITLFLVCLFLASMLVAQENRASISGQVTDSSAAAVPRAKIVVTSVERGTASEVSTNDTGRYQVGFLDPGTYIVTVEAPGFKKSVQKDIQLLTAQKLGLDVALEVGAQAESVTVTGEAPLLQTETAVRGQTMSIKELRDVPSNGRIFLQAVWAMAGVVRNTNDYGSMGASGVANATAFSINGGRNGENEVLLDGVSDVAGDRQVKHIPSLEMIQEFRVITNPFDAQYGRTGGGAISITTKGGENTIHGVAYESYRGSYGSANSWSANRQGIPITSRHSNAFGAQLAGPVWIPKVLNGKNKLFFMFNYEGLVNNGVDGATFTIPQPEQFGGNFANLVNANGTLVTIYDPLTTRPDGKGGSVRTPFANNQIPSGRLNPIATKVASYYPKPSRVGDTLALINNYSLPIPNFTGNNTVASRIDYIINERNRIHFRYSNTPYHEIRFIQWGNNVAEPSGNAPLTRNGVNWSGDWTGTISPTTVANLRFGLTRWEDFSGNTYGQNYDPRQLGFPDSLVKQFGYLQFPGFGFSGTTLYGQIGTNRPGDLGKDYAYSLQPNLNLVRGTHILKIGSDFKRFDKISRSIGVASGFYTFSKGYTQADPLRGDATSGNEFASFLLGYPDGGTVAKNMDPAYRSYYYSGFVQDDWKATPRLTLNLGFRWDYEAPLAERYNRQIRGFDFNVASPIASQVQGLALKGGLMYAGDSGEMRQAFNRDFRHFQPRVGVAYRLGDNWVIRGGYGIFFLGQYETGWNIGYSQPTSLSASSDGGLTPRVTLSNPFPEPLLQPIGNSRGLATALGQGITAQWLDRPLPYTHQMSLGLQRQIGRGWLLESAYSGNFSRRLPVNASVNNIPESQLGQIGSYYTTKIANPMAGQLPDSPVMNAATITRSSLLVPFPQYGGFTLTSLPIGHQSYHSMQNTITKRLSTGWTFQATYTIAKTLEAVQMLNATDFNLANPLQSKLTQQLTQYDVPQKLTVVSTWQIPIGRNRALGKNMNKALDMVIGGWQLNGNFVVQEGFPIDFANAAPVRPGSAKLSKDQRTMYRWFDTSLWMDPATGKPVTQTPFTLRNFPLRFPDVRFSTLKNLGASVFKSIPIHESLRFEIRVDSFNVSNTPWFSSSSGNTINTTSPTFGTLSLGSNAAARSFGFQGRLVW